MDVLQDIRDHFKKAVNINSAYRTEAYNKKVGGASKSQHLYGKAADIVISGVKPREIAEYAESKGVGGIGLYEYGGTSGLVTMEDLLEELVGNIYDEFDPKEEQEIVQVGDNLWRIAGSAELEDVADALGVELPEEELLTKAEAFAIRSGGRSPRVAKQFVELCRAGVQ